MTQWFKKEKKIARGNRKFHASSFSKYESMKVLKKKTLHRKKSNNIRRTSINIQSLK